jgi:hypothetical protein
VTTTKAAEVMAGYCMIFGTNAGSYASGWTGTGTIAGDPSGYNIVSSTGAQAFTAGQGSSNRYVGAIATYYALTPLSFPMVIADTSTVSHLDFHAGTHIPMTVADTSTVSHLDFHAGTHIAMVVADTSTISHLDFHAGSHFAMVVADTSTVALGFHVVGHFPVAIADTSTVSHLDFHKTVPTPIVPPPIVNIPGWETGPIPVPIYAGQSQTRQIVNANPMPHWELGPILSALTDAGHNQATQIVNAKPRPPWESGPKRL